MEILIVNIYNEEDGIDICSPAPSLSDTEPEDNYIPLWKISFLFWDELDLQTEMHSLV